jgi:transcriptional regulator with XRE-family HTH domain
MGGGGMIEVYLWEIRVLRKLTMSKLSALCGLSKSTLSNIESGKTSPTLEQLETLARALNVGINDLYDSPLKPSNGGKTAAFVHIYGNSHKPRDKPE